MKFPRNLFEEPKLVVIPIVDVLLAVFLFLAVLAFKTPFVSVFVQLPEGKGREANLNVVNITITKDGRIFVGKKEVKPENLGKFLKEKNPFVVNVMADERTPYRFVAKLLSKLQELKITNVNLLLKEKKG